MPICSDATIESNRPIHKEIIMSFQKDYLTTLLQMLISNGLYTSSINEKNQSNVISQKESLLKNVFGSISVRLKRLSFDSNADNMGTTNNQVSYLIGNEENQSNAVEFESASTEFFNNGSLNATTSEVQMTIDHIKKEPMDNPNKK